MSGRQRCLLADAAVACGVVADITATCTAATAASASDGIGATTTDVTTAATMASIAVEHEGSEHSRSEGERREDRSLSTRGSATGYDPRVFKFSDWSRRLLSERLLTQFGRSHIAPAVQFSANTAGCLCLSMKPVGFLSGVPPETDQMTYKKSEASIFYAKKTAEVGER